MESALIVQDMSVQERLPAPVSYHQKRHYCIAKRFVETKVPLTIPWHVAQQLHLGWEEHLVGLGVWLRGVEVQRVDEDVLAMQQIRPHVG